MDRYSYHRKIRNTYSLKTRFNARDKESKVLVEVNEPRQYSNIRRHSEDNNGKTGSSNDKWFFLSSLFLTLVSVFSLSVDWLPWPVRGIVGFALAFTALVLALAYFRIYPK